MVRILSLAFALALVGGIAYLLLSGPSPAQAQEPTPIRTITAGQTTSFAVPLPSATDRQLCEGHTWNASEQRCYFGHGNSYRSTACLGPFRYSLGNDYVYSISVTNAGSGYTSATVTISGDGRGAEATATISSGGVGSITMVKHGFGYTRATVRISGDGSGATAQAVLAESPFEGITMSGSTIRMNTDADGPYGDFTISYEVAGRQSVWSNVNQDDGWTVVLTNARCTVQHSVVVRVLQPNTVAHSGVQWALAQARAASPGQSDCMVWQRDRGTMSWCGPGDVFVDGQWIPVEDACALPNVTCRRN